MEWYDWLLFLHVAAAFSLVSAMVAFWTLVIVTRRGSHPAMQALGRPAGILVGLGTAFTLVFGIWLAIDHEEYQVWDGWILASIVLWAIATGIGQRAGVLLGRAGEGGSEAVAVRRRGVAFHATSSLLIVVILVLMIFKPGA